MLKLKILKDSKIKVTNRYLIIQIGLSQDQETKYKYNHNRMNSIRQKLFQNIRILTRLLKLIKHN